jgi:mannose-6-phosphate isomerase-like protein (cupin superfamily)
LFHATLLLGVALTFVLSATELAAMQETPTEDAAREAPVWQAFDIADLEARRAEQGRPWHEFLRVPDLFAGVYHLPAGGEDGQPPHEADEIYYVLRGRGTLLVEGDRVPAGPGSVLYVAKQAEHRFVDITEDLTVLVFFATPGGG